MDAFMLIVVNLLGLLWVTGVDGDIIVKDSSTNHTINSYPDMQAGFGPDFLSDGLEGWLVYASPDPNACRPVNRAPVNETKCNESRCNYILLIARGGDCEFSDKVLNAQRHHYAAVIVHNYIHNEDVISMGGGINGSLVSIPSTFVGYSNGMELWQYNYTHRKYVITIIEDDEELKLFLWPFAVVVGVCFLIFMLLMLVKLLRERASKQVNRLSKKHLKKIPVRKFKKGDYYDTCAICLDEYEEGEKIRVLPCDHVYHMKCIDPWLTKNKKTCPVCKRRVIPERDANSESDSDAEGGHTTAGDSEHTPLLGSNSGQSHGSIADSGALLNPSRSAAENGIQGNSSSVVDGSSVMPSDVDVEHGAVGGEGISDRKQPRQTLLSLSAPGQGNIQDGDERKDSHSERKRKRRDWTRTDEDEEAAGTSLGSGMRTEQRERRKHRKDKKKKAENRVRRQEGDDVAQVSVEQRIEGQENVNQEDVSHSRLGQAETDDVQTRILEGGGYVNPSYSDSHEVVVEPAMGDRREMNDVV